MKNPYGLLLEVARLQAQDWELRLSENGSDVEFHKSIPLPFTAGDELFRFVVRPLRQGDQVTVQALLDDRPIDLVADKGTIIDLPGPTEEDYAQLIEIVDLLTRFL